MLASCREEEKPVVQDDPPVEENPNIKINQWTQEVMEEVYYWLENLQPAISIESDPKLYFDTLLYKPTDRHSAIYESTQELQDGLGGVATEAGYEFALYTTNTPEQVIAEVIYIKKNSPAMGKDLQRGDVIAGINGQEISRSNYRNLLRDMRNPHTISYFRYDNEEDRFIQKPDLQMEVARVEENPNFMDTVFTVNNDKIGYFVYHFFAPNPNPQNDRESTVYDSYMDEIFGRFKTAGINHLIIDFRYNGGGYVSSAVNLASLIGTGVTSNDVFSKTKYNSFIMSFPAYQNDQRKFINKAENIGPQLFANRVYILTSRRTASASELVINSLRPYMEVIIIGEQTVGKNVGSIVIDDEDNHNYALMPIISQSFNSLDQSDYANGFEPNVKVSEGEERLLPFGNRDEILLRTAIQQITGLSTNARYEKLNRLDVGSSLDYKIRQGKMIDYMDFY